MMMKITLASLALLAPTTLAFAPVSLGTTTTTRSSRSSSSSLSVFVEIGEHVERDMASMDEWATACGVQRVDGFQFVSEDGKDWSVITSEPLAASSPVLAVPEAMILSTSKSREELREMPGSNVAEAVDQLSRLGANTEVPHFYLFLKILIEYEKGDASPWFPWLNSLPRLFYNSVSMTDFCYECLPPLVFQLSRAERVKVNNFFDAMQKVDCLSPQTKANKDLAIWAYNVVYTRAFGPDGEKSLAPMADMFNHGTDTEIALSYDEEGNCNVFTTKDVPAGSPLRMSYGCPTNPSHFFATYGFLDESSPATFCKIMTITPNKELLDIGFDFSRMLFYKETGDISEEVWDVILYNFLNSNRDHQEAFYNAHMAGDVDTKKAIHEMYLAQTTSALKAHVDTFLTVIDELSAKAEGKSLTDHPRLPLILSHNEFVKSTFETVKARLDPMAAAAARESAVSA